MGHHALAEWPSPRLRTEQMLSFFIFGPIGDQRSACARTHTHTDITHVQRYPVLIQDNVTQKLAIWEASARDGLALQSIYKYNQIYKM